MKRWRRTLQIGVPTLTLFATALVAWQMTPSPERPAAPKRDPQALEGLSNMTFCGAPLEPLKVDDASADHSRGRVEDADDASGAAAPATPEEQRLAQAAPESGCFLDDGRTG